MTDADQYCDICVQYIFTKKPHDYESESDYYNSIPELALWHDGFGGEPVFVCMGCVNASCNGGCTHE